MNLRRNYTHECDFRCRPIANYETYGEPQKRDDALRADAALSVTMGAATWFTEPCPSPPRHYEYISLFGLRWTTNTARTHTHEDKIEREGGRFGKGRNNTRYTRRERKMARRRENERAWRKEGRGQIEGIRVVVGDSRW